MQSGKVLIVIGAVILLIGLILNYAPWLVNWFGKLPGDIRIENKNSFIFFPITSLLLLSVLLSLLVNLFFRK